MIINYEVCADFDNYDQHIIAYLLMVYLPGLEERHEAESQNQEA